MPNWFGWVVGLAVFACVTVLLGWCVSWLGLPTYISYDEPLFVSNRYYDEEVDGHQTALGIWVMVVSILAGARAGMAAVKRDWNGGVKAIGNLQTSLSLKGLTAYAFIMTAAWELFGRELMRAPAIIGNGLDLIVAGAVGYLCYQHYQKKLLEMKSMET